VLGNLRFSALAAGDDQTCGVEASTALLYCWGENKQGELGIGGLDNTRIPTLTVGGLNFAQVTIRRGLTCGITTTDQFFDQGDVNTYCWGLASLGGVGWTPSVIETVSCFFGLCSPKPQMAIGFTVTSFLLHSVSVGARYACGIVRSDFGSIVKPGDVWCWGVDDRGQLGESEDFFGAPLAQCEDRFTVTTVPCSFAPRRLLGGLKFNTIGAGAAHVCGASSSGPVYCWGGRYGTTPVEVSGPGLDSAITVTVGGQLNDLSHSHACVLDVTGQAYCWGDNVNGELGNGELPALGAPVYHPNLQPVQQDTLEFVTISAGKGANMSVGEGVGHTCALTADGVIYCWGGNGAGALGNPAVDRTAVPTRIAEPEL
jgi:alpha-tubulin suppressor-like RCC1 family protein